MALACGSQKRYMLANLTESLYSVVLTNVNIHEHIHEWKYNKIQLLFIYLIKQLIWNNSHEIWHALFWPNGDFY